MRYIPKYKNPSGGIKRTQAEIDHGKRVAESADFMADNRIETRRPAVGLKEKLIKWLTLGYKDSWSGVPCVQCVKKTHNMGGIDSGIPDDIYDNVSFADNHKKYGYEMIPKEELQRGDIVQFVNKEDRPYHLGIYTGDDKYVSDGDSGNPALRKGVFFQDDGVTPKDSTTFYRKIIPDKIRGLMGRHKEPYYNFKTGPKWKPEVLEPSNLKTGGIILKIISENNKK